jgi:hypothetical protein
VGAPATVAVFMGVWIALGITSFFFYRRAAYETKKAAHPYLTIGSGILFLAFAEWISHGQLPMFFITALIVIIFFLNLRLTRFCPKCGATNYQQGFSPPTFCPQCGAPLG